MPHPQLSKFFYTLWAVYDIRGWYPAGIELFEQAAIMMREVATEEAQSLLGWLLAVQGLYSVAGGHPHTASSPAPSWMAAHGLYFVRGGSDARQGFARVQEGIRLLKQHNDPDERLIIPLMSLFITACLFDEEGVPLQTAQEFLEVALKVNDTWAIAKAKQFLAVRAIEDGQYKKAKRLAHEALATFEANGDNWSSSIVYIEVLGLLAITLRKFETAKEWLHSGIKSAEQISFKYSIQTAYWQLGFVAALQQNYSEAGRYWHKALAVHDGILGSATSIGFGGSNRVTE